MPSDLLWRMLVGFSRRNPCSSSSRPADDVNMVLFAGRLNPKLKAVPGSLRETIGAKAWEDTIAMVEDLECLTL